MKYDWRLYIDGKVIIKISGSMPERFINMCVLRHIYLWNIYKHQDDFYACIRLCDFFSIRPIARQSGNKIKVIGAGGFPFLIKRICKRKMLAIGAIFFILLLQVLGSYTWFVEVTGNQTVSEEFIREVAGEYGLTVGSPIHAMNPEKIEKELLERVPSLAWVGIQRYGTRTVIEVVEKTQGKIEDDSPADLLAAKSGVITDLIVLAGKAAVKKGDTVRKGDLLIEGVKPQPETEEGAEIKKKLPVEFLRAKGIVKARVWYEGYGEAACKETVYRRTGEKSTAIKLLYGRREWVIKPLQENPYPLFETEIVHKKLPVWRNRDFAVELTINIYHQLFAEEQERSLSVAKEKARSEAWARLQALLPENIQILNRSEETIELAEPDLVRIKIGVEALEEIAQPVTKSQ